MYTWYICYRRNQKIYLFVGFRINAMRYMRCKAKMGQRWKYKKFYDFLHELHFFRDMHCIPAKPHGKRRLDRSKQKQYDKYNTTCIDTCFFLRKTSFKYNGLSKRPFVTPETSTWEDEDLNERKMFVWSVSNDYVGLFSNKIMLNGNVLLKSITKTASIRRSLSGAHNMNM